VQANLSARCDSGITITGDVRIEAEVDKTGGIGAMKILLGPKQSGKWPWTRAAV